MSVKTRIENIWYSAHWTRWILWPASLPFLMIVVLKRWFYLIGLIKSKASAVPIIVVGNIIVGGTGKTPFIQFLVKLLQAQSLNVGIVSRGYRSNASTYPHLLKASDSVSVVGDEAFMQFHRLNIPMAIGPDRIAAIELLTQQSKLDLIISDDGLQHYTMARNIEFLVCDATRGFGNKLVLPFGPLREPIARAKSVDFIIKNGTKHILDLDEFNEKVAEINLKVSGLVHVVSGEPVSLSNITQKTVNAVCGIGNPQRFFNSLQPLCKNMTKVIFEDHHDFQLSDFSRLSEFPVVMTEKDAVKCRNFALDNWYYLKVEVEISQTNATRIAEVINRKITKRIN